MIHVWVDPHYGNDTLAGQRNPSCSNGCNPPSECKPSDVADGIGNPLLHASWPFRTITTALSYIPPLPYSTQGIIWEYAVIHLLPGIYARSTAYGMVAGTPNPNNGLIPNGETFPIVLPNRVSIQGTSALNTIFDLGPINTQVANTGGPAFEFGTSANSTGLHSFIDKVAIHGAFPGMGLGASAAKKYAAISIAPAFASAPTITNCFLYANGIGVLVDATSTTTHDGTILMNNTIAMNHVGLWSGDINAVSGNKGWSKLILINNIFDSRMVDPAVCPVPANWPAATLAPITNHGFEGVDGTDMVVTNLTPQSNFNAFELGNVNLGVALPLVLLPATTYRTSSAGAPVFDLAPITGAPLLAERRGTLYIRDLLCNGPFQSANSMFDRSPHDFRLAPATARANDAPLTDGQPGFTTDGAWNLAVNGGWLEGFPATMQNGLTLPYAPGFLPLPSTDQNTWPHATVDLDAEDCEGFGNRRVHLHARDANSDLIYPKGNLEGIDIGADELSQNVLAGYRHGTTAFLNLTGGNLPPGVTSPMDNKYMWVIGPPTASVDPPMGFTWITPTPVLVTTVRACFRAVDHLASPPPNYFQSTPAYYPPWFGTWGWGAGSYYQPPVVNITPHLLGDHHPWWPPDPFGLASAANPIWQHCIAEYNPALYLDPSEQVINPPGTYHGDGTNYQWLDLTWTVTSNPPSALIQRFGQTIGFRPAPTHLITAFDEWCRGYVPPDTVRFDTFLPTFSTPSNTSYRSVRYALEHNEQPPFGSSGQPLVEGTNLQSFLVIVEEAQ